MLITASLTLRGDSFSSPDLFWVLGNHRELYQQSRHLEEACWEGHRADTLADTGEFKDTMGSFPVGLWSLKEKQPERLYTVSGTQG